MSGTIVVDGTSVVITTNSGDDTSITFTTSERAGYITDDVGEKRYFKLVDKWSTVHYDGVMQDKAGEYLLFEKPDHEQVSKNRHARRRQRALTRRK